MQQRVRQYSQFDRNNAPALPFRIVQIIWGGGSRVFVRGARPKSCQSDERLIVCAHIHAYNTHTRTLGIPTPYGVGAERTQGRNLITHSSAPLICLGWGLGEAAEWTIGRERVVVARLNSALRYDRHIKDVARRCYRLNGIVDRLAQRRFEEKTSPPS